MSLTIYLEIGHNASLRTKKTQEGFTHDWEVYVKGCNGADIQYYVDKIVFNLHETFAKPKRVVKEPPYSVRTSGYAGFTLPIEIYLKNNQDPKKIRFDYDLYLQDTGPPIQKAQKEKYVFFNPSEEFRFKLLKGGALSGSSASSIQDIDFTNRNAEDRNSMTSKPKLSGSEMVKKHKYKLDEPRNSDFSNLFGTPILKTSKTVEILKPKDASSKTSLKPEKVVDKSEKNKTKSPHKEREKEKQKEKSSDGGGSGERKSKDEKRKSKDEKNRERDRSREKSSKKERDRDKSPNMKQRSPSPSKRSPKRPPSPPPQQHHTQSSKHSSGVGGSSSKDRDKDTDRSDKKDRERKDEKKSKKDKKEHKDGNKHKDRDHKEHKSSKEGRSKENAATSAPPPVRALRESSPVHSGGAAVTNSQINLKEKTEKKYQQPKEKDTSKDQQQTKIIEEDKNNDNNSKSSASRAATDRSDEKKEKTHKHKKRDRKDKHSSKSAEKEKKSSSDRPPSRCSSANSSTVKETAKDAPSSLPSSTKDTTTKSNLFGSPKSEPNSPVTTAATQPELKVENNLHSSYRMVVDEDSSNDASSSVKGLNSSREPSPVAATVPPVPIPTTALPTPKQAPKSPLRPPSPPSPAAVNDEVPKKQEIEKKSRSSSSLGDDSVAKKKEKKEKKKDKRAEKDLEKKRKRKSDSTSDQPPPEKVLKEEENNNSDDESKVSSTEDVVPVAKNQCDMEMLRDLQHKIMGLKDNADLQKVVQLIAETGQYEVSAHTFDFDLCLLDRSTVRQLQDFFASIS